MVSQCVSQFCLSALQQLPRCLLFSSTQRMFLCQESGESDESDESGESDDGAKKARGQKEDITPMTCSCIFCSLAMLAASSHLRLMCATVFAYMLLGHHACNPIFISHPGRHPQS